MSDSNPTGFNKRELMRAANPKSEWARRDPWARYEAWRYTGPFSRWNRFNRSLPGLGTATVAFAGYLIYEQLFLKDDHGHGEGHGEAEGHGGGH